MCHYGRQLSKCTLHADTDVEIYYYINVERDMWFYCPNLPTSLTARIYGCLCSAEKLRPVSLIEAEK